MNSIIAGIKNWLSTERLLAISLGVCYFWFGVLKFFPGASPAESLARETINLLTLGLIPSDLSIFLLAIWETSLGVLFMINYVKKPVVLLALVHIILTFSPMFLLPDLSFNGTAYLPTLLGQYIAKNFVFISGFIILLKRAE